MWIIFVHFYLFILYIFSVLVWTNLYFVPFCIYCIILFLCNSDIIIILCGSVLFYSFIHIYYDGHYPLLPFTYSFVHCLLSIGRALLYYSFHPRSYLCHLCAFTPLTFYLPHITLLVCSVSLLFILPLHYCVVVTAGIPIHSFCCTFTFYISHVRSFVRTYITFLLRTGVIYIYKCYYCCIWYIFIIIYCIFSSFFCTSFQSFNENIF